MDLLKESNRLTTSILNSLKRELHEAAEDQLRTAVIYTGRFQPFHAGNYKIYKQLGQQFGPENVFIAVSDELHPESSQDSLSFDDKKYIISNMFPIGENKVYKVEDPFNPVEILSHFDKNHTAFILVLSDKDVPLISDNDYFHLYVKGLQIQPLSQAGYYMPVPDKFITIGGAKVSMDQVGQIFSSQKLSPEAKNEFFKKLYGREDKKALQLVSGKPTAVAGTGSEFEKTPAKDKDIDYSTKSKEKTDEPQKKKSKEKSEPHPALRNVSLDTMIVNPETNNKIKLGSALKYPRDKKVYQKAVKVMGAAGKDRPDRTSSPIVNRSWKDRSIKRNGYADNDEDDKKKKNESVDINQLAISLAEEFAKDLENK